MTLPRDGEHIFSDLDDYGIRDSDAKTGVVSGSFEGHFEGVTSIALSPDGKRIVSGSWSAKIRVWDVETGEVVFGPFGGHSRHITSVMFSPDGNRIVSGSLDMTIRLSDTETGEIVLGPLEGHTDWVESVTFSPDGKRIVSVSWDSMICVWDAETGDTVAVFNSGGHIGRGKLVTFLPDGKHVVADSWGNRICVWNPETSEVVSRPFEWHIQGNCVAISHDGKHIVSSDNRAMRVWDAETGDVVSGPLKGHTKNISSVAFSPDGRHVISASLIDQTIRVWDVAANDVAIQPLPGHSGGPKNIHNAQSINSTTCTSSRFGDTSKLVDGWILGPNLELLFWVPPSLCIGLWWPRNTVVIAKVSTKLDFKSFCHGNSWAQCKR
jgi:WD40 repeat protein